MYQAMISEIAKNKLEDFKPSFDEINKKMSPNELLQSSETLGISGDKLEVEQIKQEINGLKSGFLPKEGGEWCGKVGDSTWLPSEEEIPKRPPSNEKTWSEILKKYEVDGIEFKDGEPDFTPFSEGTVEIEDFTDDRNANFTQADEKLAEQWTTEGKDGKEWTAQDIKEYRKENQLSWHERSDMKTLELTPQEVHGNVPHLGGISALKNSQNETTEGV